jgi:nucleoside-diphosphate-sugar epimerase
MSLMQLADADAAQLSTRVYNLDGFSASTREIVDAVQKYVPGADISWQFDPEYQRVMDTQYGNIQHRMDDSLARTDWDWQPSYSLEEAVHDFIDDVRQGRT